ncbi:MAG: DUF935 family protein [Armatimonadetes bacterium]|nr:DUF935 family protein [Armatimonadota bacterium]
MLRLFNRNRNGRKRRQRDEAPAIARAVTGSFMWPGAAGQAFGQRLSLSVYDEMLTDPLVRSAVVVKKLGALAVPWHIEAADESSESRRRSAFIEYVLNEMNGSATGVLFDAMDAIAKGYAILEKVFVTDEREFPGMVRLYAVKPKDPALFGFDVDEFLNIKGLTLHVPGEKQRNLPISKFVVYAHSQRYGAPAGESDLRAAHRHWCIKRELIKQWSGHLEKFASPTVIGRFKRGLPQDAQAALLDALEKLQRQSAVVHPDDIDVSLLDGGREARSAYMDAIDYHNREIARAILGQTLTTDDSRRVGSLALGKVHLQVLIMQLAGLRRDLAERVMNEQIIRPLIDLNFGGGLYPTFEFEEPDLDVFRTGKVV